MSAETQDPHWLWRPALSPSDTAALLAEVRRRREDTPPVTSFTAAFEAGPCVVGESEAGLRDALAALEAEHARLRVHHAPGGMYVDPAQCLACEVAWPCADAAILWPEGTSAVVAARSVGLEWPESGALDGPGATNSPEGYASATSGPQPR